MIKESISATAPGKIILFGEHAVVYGQPAIAVPVHQVQATVTVTPAPAGSGLTVRAVDLSQVISLAAAPEDDPLARAVRLTLAHLGQPVPDVTLCVTSTIPIASGLGSGAAVSTALVRALAAYLGRPLTPATVSQLVYEVEKLHHGTPSGIDNTVVAYGMPVYFVRGPAGDAQMQTFGVATPHGTPDGSKGLRFLIGDTGVSSPTRVAVGDVRRGWERDPARYEGLFAQVGALVGQARALIQAGGDLVALGTLMDRNHTLLRQMGVSSPELERLVEAARAAGAVGAKLSGAGRGGNMIALLPALRQAPAVSLSNHQDVEGGGRVEAQVKDALQKAGAMRVIGTTVV
jgi:mevalonate kinase